jgi:hypothetical protein
VRESPVDDADHVRFTANGKVGTTTSRRRLSLSDQLEAQRQRSSSIRRSDVVHVLAPKMSA